MNILTKVLLLTLVGMLLGACATDDYIGDVEQPYTDVREISFINDASSLTRAEGSAAATALGNNFVIFGQKTLDEATTSKQVVFDHYNVNYIDNSAFTTTTNTCGWEYAGQSRKIKHATPYTLSSILNGTAGEEQSIKYWDNKASQYDFVAFSLGNGATFAEATAYSTDGKFSNTLQGSLAEITGCYLSEKKTMKKADMTGGYHTNGAVQMKFIPLNAKIRIGLYETIPGYSVKDVKFYADKEATAGILTDPTIYAASKVYPAADATDLTVSVSYTDTKPAVTMKTAATNSAITTGAMTFTTAERKEGEGNYIGRTSQTASLPNDYTKVLPYKNQLPVTVKMDYTLVSRDGQDEIQIKGATATIPAEYADWKMGYAYTYLFKINDSQLNPITFDAITIEGIEGEQQTITTIATTSITTYTKAGADENGYYTEGDNIYVCVSNGEVLTTSNIKFYWATSTGTIADINEAVVQTALESTGDEKEASLPGGYKVSVADNTTTAYEIVDKIPATETPDGNVISSTHKFAKFTAALPTDTEHTLLVVEYTGGTAETPVKAYKVIRIKANTTTNP